MSIRSYHKLGHCAQQCWWLEIEHCVSETCSMWVFSIVLTIASCTDSQIQCSCTKRCRHWHVIDPCRELSPNKWLSQRWAGRAVTASDKPIRNGIVGDATQRMDQQWKGGSPAFGLTAHRKTTTNWPIIRVLGNCLIDPLSLFFSSSITPRVCSPPPFPPTGSPFPFFWFFSQVVFFSFTYPWNFLTDQGIFPPLKSFHIPPTPFHTPPSFQS